ncbi:MAG TPA: S8 family serine peptidase [bacterium]
MKKLLLLLLGVLWVVPGFALVSPDLQGVMTRARTSDLIPIDIVLKEQMDSQKLIDAVKGLPKSERRMMVAQILTDFSREHQKELVAYLKDMEKVGRVTDITPLWINNGIYCRASRDIIAVLDKRNDIFYVDYDLKPIQLENPSRIVAPPDKTGKTREIAWGVSKINADQVWVLGYTGQGIVVGHIDTGINYNHVDLADHLWTDANYPHHGWNFESATDDPIDIAGHGTHTAGSVASDGTAGSQCGVAPDAQVMGLRVRTTADSVAEWQVYAAMQFVVAPPLSPAHGGDLITMSLGWRYAWAPHRSVWRTTCNNVGAANVVMIVAAGNERGVDLPPNALRCPGDVPSPWRHPANGATGAQSDVVSIGATDINDAYASFSAPGPVHWDGIAPFNDYVYPPGLTKPDVSAPGVNVKSCDYQNNSGYLDGWNGTSMATPHCAGAVALMLQKNPYLTIREIDSILQVTAVDLGPAGKDMDFGAGRINALAAVNATPSPGAPVTPSVISPLNYARLPTLTPTLRFTTTDPQGDRVIYRIFWDTDTTFSTPDSSTTASFASGATAQFVFPALASGDTYWWRVKAADTTGSGFWSGMTSRRSFTVDPAGLPANTCSWYQTQGDQFVNCTFSATRVQGDSVTLVPLGYVQDTLMFQNFEAGSMPAGWTVVNGNGDAYLWTVGTTGDIGGYAPPTYGVYYAYYSDDDAGSGVTNNNEELISPKIYVPASAANLSVIYGWGFQIYETGEKYRVKFRKKVGAAAWTAWTDLIVYTASGNGTQTISLSAQLPCDSIQFDWFYSDSTAASHWGYANAADNVLVSYDWTFQNNAGTLTGPGVVYHTLATTYARSAWGDVVWRKAAATDSIGMQVEYYNGAIWQLVPNALIPGNSSGIFKQTAADTVRLNLVTDTVTYNTLRLKGLFYRITKAPGDPALLDWEVGNLSRYVGVAERKSGGTMVFGLSLMPNPSSKRITIHYALSTKDPAAQLRIFDAAGRLVKLFNHLTIQPVNQIVWDGSDDVGRSVPAGVYFIRLESDGQEKIEKAVLLR